jgi:hypothetical protein
MNAPTLKRLYAALMNWLFEVSPPPRTEKRADDPAIAAIKDAA